MNFSSQNFFNINLLTQKLFLDRLDGLKRKTDNHPQTMEDFLQVPDYYDMEDTSGKKRVRIVSSFIEYEL